ncbi:MAG: hypothetical protein VKK04_00845 [Synechococcales bacterium]|nr:hypothetical protein [Synechococcales bacterium]
MVILHLIQSTPDLLAALPDWGTLAHLGHPSLPHISPSDWSLLAQQFETDVFAGARTWFNNFVQSGQIWALIIGIIIGYLLRGLTTYG